MEIFNFPTATIPIFLRILAILFPMIKVHANNTPYQFIERSYPQVILADLTEDDLSHAPAYRDPESIQKLCFYAKLKAQLPYIGDDFAAEWKKLYIPYPMPKPVAFALYCPTLPTIYIISKRSNYKELQITYLLSSVSHYKINTGTIQHADSVTEIKISEANLDEKLSESCLTKLSLEDRRNLCVEAQKHVGVTLHFLDRNVSEANTYKFEHSGIVETDFAFPCPTSPQLYIRRGNSDIEVKLVVVSGVINQYDFEVDGVKPTSITRVPVAEYSRSAAELFSRNSLTQLKPEDRKNVCIIARKYYDSEVPVPFVRDKTVPIARLYSFRYEAEGEIRRLAVVCPAVPMIFLYLDEVSMLDNQIKITFEKTIADQYNYKVVPEINFQYFYRVEETERIQSERKILEQHLFTTLDKENTWNLCFRAQKFLLSDKSTLFYFTKHESIFEQYKLLLIPKYVAENKPGIYKIRHNNDKDEIVVLLECSVWPRVHIHLGEVPNEIEIFVEGTCPRL